jgi:hypothetical protein
VEYGGLSRNRTREEIGKGNSQRLDRSRGEFGNMAGGEVGMTEVHLMKGFTVGQAEKPGLSLGVTESFGALSVQDWQGQASVSETPLRGQYEGYMGAEAGVQLGS